MYKFPSAFERVFGAMANMPEAIEFNGYKWIVGKVSKNAEYPVNLQDLEYFYPLVVKKVSPQDDAVAVSLPAETYFEDKISGGELIEHLQSRIRNETGISAVVLPQGAIAITEIVAQGHLDPDKTLIIDGGFNTLNIVIVEKDGDIAYTKTYYNEFGIRDLLENHFKPQLKRKYPEVTSNLQRLKDVFLKEEIDAGLQIIDVRNEKNFSLKAFLDRLFNRILKDVERAGEDFRQFAIVGGLSYYVPEVQTNKPYFIPQSNGEFYTVLGMKRYSGLLSIDFGFGDVKVSE